MKFVLMTVGLALALTLSVVGGSNVGAFIVDLSGDQEVAPVLNSFVGYLGMSFEEDLSAAEVNLTVYAPNVTGAHLHCGRAGTNGPIVVSLLPGGLFFPATDAAGKIGVDMITNDDIRVKTEEECGMPINNLASLLGAIRADNIYVNVHTSAFPPGALRAQLWGHLLD